MAERSAKPGVVALTAMAHVSDVQRSVDFYGLLGMQVKNSLRDSFNSLQWVYLVRDRAELMLARASGPVDPGQQAVLFYFYAADLISLREHLLANGIQVSAITHPNYMPKGEIRVEDPDRYVLLIGQAG